MTIRRSGLDEIIAVKAKSDLNSIHGTDPSRSQPSNRPASIDGYRQSRAFEPDDEDYDALASRIGVERPGLAALSMRPKRGTRAVERVPAEDRAQEMQLGARNATLASALLVRNPLPRPASELISIGTQSIEQVNAIFRHGPRDRPAAFAVRQSAYEDSALPSVSSAAIAQTNLNAVNPQATTLIDHWVLALITAATDLAKSAFAGISDDALCLTDLKPNAFGRADLTPFHLKTAAIEGSGSRHSFAFVTAHLAAENMSSSKIDGYVGIFESRPFAHVDKLVGQWEPSMHSPPVFAACFTDALSNERSNRLEPVGEPIVLDSWQGDACARPISETAYSKNFSRQPGFVFKVAEGVVSPFCYQAGSLRDQDLSQCLPSHDCLSAYSKGCLFDSPKGLNYLINRFQASVASQMGARPNPGSSETGVNDVLVQLTHHKPNKY